jgi:hypothetical protein
MTSLRSQSRNYGKVCYLSEIKRETQEKYNISLKLIAKFWKNLTLLGKLLTITRNTKIILYKSKHRLRADLK